MTGGTSPSGPDESRFTQLLAVVCDEDGGDPFGWSDNDPAGPPDSPEPPTT